MRALRAHMSDGHLYAGSKVRQWQYKKYFLVSENLLDEQVFLNLYDAENYCQKHGYNPDESIKSGDREVWIRCREIAGRKSQILKEQADILYKMVQKNYVETQRLAEIRNKHEAENKRNFDREWDQEKVSESVAKGSGMYEAYKAVWNRYWYYEQILLFATKP